MRRRGVVIGGNLWRVGFHIHSIAAINWLSGLVDIHETTWLPDQEAIVFMVTNRDTTGTLFRNGELQACPINGYQPTAQDMLVEWPGGHVFARGGN
jgi:hypothetical protein